MVILKFLVRLVHKLMRTFDSQLSLNNSYLLRSYLQTARENDARHKLILPTRVQSYLHSVNVRLKKNKT